MFDISFGEIILIGVVALVVLGPERLPTVARTLGSLLGRAQRFVATVKADIQQQANLSGLNEIRQDFQDAASSFKNKVEAEVGSVREVIEHNVAEVRAVAHNAEAQVQEIVHTVHEDLHHTAEVPQEASVTEAVSLANENQPDLFESPPSPLVPNHLAKPKSDPSSHE
ncbi:Sec-independent protein translocase protein TatB [Neisseriaceae bacterium TC5R-5]|nr:Sec-independent protein translocase protein TatB [Neisseriaceae bacterium TC5R-5]